MTKTKVTLVDDRSSDPYYIVYTYVPSQSRSVGYWSTAKVFSFRYSGEGIWSQEANLKLAMDFANRLEKAEEKTEIVIYETKNDFGSEDGS